MPDSHTNSFVEEAFYVVQQSGSRATATGSAACICGVINSVVGTLESVVLATLVSRLETSAANCGTVGVVAVDAGVGGVAGDDPRTGTLSTEFYELAVAVNNIEVGVPVAGGVCVCGACVAVSCLVMGVIDSRCLLLSVINLLFGLSSSATAMTLGCPSV